MHLVPVLSLFFLSPLVAEFLLGNISIDAIWALSIIAPLYGGGAVLIRELARRYSRTWSRIFLLAFAFAIFVEGLVTQSIFNRSYFGFDLHQFAYIESLGIGAWWTLYVLAIHTVWSIAVPIALAEALFPDSADRPWLGSGGLLIVFFVFLFGAIFNFGTTWQQEGFVGSAMQLGSASLACIGIVIVALRFPWKQGTATCSTPVRSWMPGIFCLFVCSIFSLGLYLPGWFVVIAWLALIVVTMIVLQRWSTKTWSKWHRFSLMSGALLTYAWQGFPHTPVLGTSGIVDYIGNTVFALGSLLLLFVAYGRVLQSEKSEIDAGN